MSWLFSRALVEEYSAANYSDGAASALLNSSPTPRAFLPNDKMTDFSRPSRFGMTFGPLTESLGADVLTWFLAGFPVRTSAQPERELESKVSEADSGWKGRESSVKYDPAMRLWKTRQYSLLEDSEWFSETWPRWGLMRDGESWELPMSARHTFERGSGLLPTPRKQMHRKPPVARCGMNSEDYHWNLEEALGGRPNPRFVEWMMGWPGQWTSLHV